jgi:hypothetical protein
MSKGFAKTANVRKINTEIDGIARINSFKQQQRGRIQGSDSLSNNEDIPPEQLPPPPIGRIVGSDESTSAPPQQASDSQGTHLPPAPMTFHDDGTLTITETQLKMLIDGGIRQETAQFQQQLQQAQDSLAEAKKQQDAIEDAAQKEQEKLQAQVETERKQRDTYARVFSQFGYAAPESDRAPSQTAFIAPLSTRGGMSPKDAVQEFERRCKDKNTTEARLVTTPTGSYVQRNSRYTDQFFVENRKVLREGIDAIARQHGLLQGRNQAWNGKDAPTTFANFPIALREYLSQVVRIEHSARFVLWQFCNKEIYTGIPINQTVLVPRVRHLNVGVTSSDWRLTPGIRSSYSPKLKRQRRFLSRFWNGVWVKMLLWNR